MYIYLGDIPAGVTFPFFFPAYDSNGASVTITGLATTDIEIYKGTSMTQRASDNGFALIDTDGIDIDSATGIHGFSVDFSDNSDSGFYAAGSFYNLVVNAITIDSQTVRFIFAFRLRVAENTSGTPVVDAGRIGGTSQTGRDIGASVLLSSGTGTGQVSLSSGTVTLTDASLTAAKIGTGAITSAKFAAGAIDAAAIATGAIDADALATDAAQEIRNAITGGAYALDTDANGRVRIVDGTGAGELDTSSGHVTLADGSLVTAKLGTFALAKTTNITGFNDLSAAQVNSEVDTGLADIRLDELLAADSDIDGAAPPTVGSVFHELMSKTTGSFTFDQTTDSLEALRDRGDAAWITATGFSTHSASDVWAVATRLLTAGTNIELAKGIGVTGFNDISAADVWANGTRTLTALGFTLDSDDTDSTYVNELRNAITGGAYALNTSASGSIRVVDGTGTDELDLTSGKVQISGTLNTLDALDTAQDVEHDATQAAIAALNNLSAAQILTTTLTESYATNGSAFTLAQGLYAIHQMLMDFAISGTSYSVKKLDGTAAFTVTLDDATSPTSAERA